jgi:hypothetical protein
VEPNSMTGRFMLQAAPDKEYLQQIALKFGFKFNFKKDEII